MWLPYRAAAQIQRQFRRGQFQADAQALLRAAQAQAQAQQPEHVVNITVEEGEPPVDAGRATNHSELPVPGADDELELVPMAEVELLLEESAAAVEQMRL